MSEWFKVQPWKGCVREIAPRVRISFSAPIKKQKKGRYIMKIKTSKEYDFYTQNVDKDLKKYVEEHIFPEYDKNDKGHGILHILEVVRRSFELKKTLNLNHLDDNMIFTIAACHDNGKYENSDIHEKIAANRFIKDENFKKFFSDEERKTIKEAIEDHRSSFEDVPRSDYGKLISSADRNSTIEIVFIRSFFVGQVRTPEYTVEEFLDFTWRRLSKRYSEEKSENMFYEDETYAKFLADMRKLLKNESAFKDRYCEVNHIQNRNGKLIDEKGCESYLSQTQNKQK